MTKRIAGKDSERTELPLGARRLGKYKSVPPWPSDADLAREFEVRRAFGNDPDDRGTIGIVEDIREAAGTLLEILAQPPERDHRGRLMLDSFAAQADRVGRRKRLTDLLRRTVRVLEEIGAPGLKMPDGVELEIGKLSRSGLSDRAIREQLRTTTVDAVRKARERLGRGAYLGEIDGTAAFHDGRPRPRGRPRK